MQAGRSEPDSWSRAQSFALAGGYGATVAWDGRVTDRAARPVTFASQNGGGGMCRKAIECIRYVISS